VEQNEGGFIPRPPWRPPTTAELDTLLGPPTGPAAPPDPDSCVCLFELPRHLQAAWWHLLEQAAPVLAEGRVPGVESFVRQVAEFLAFKDLPLPAGARCDVVVCKPGQPAVPWVPPVLSSETEEIDQQGPWGGINLGTEQTSVVLVPPPYGPSAAEQRHHSLNRTSRADVGQLVGESLGACPDCPTVRVLLEPGEGYRLPPTGVTVLGHWGPMQEPDVRLVISRDGSKSG
jgi:hypothetical protein